MQEPSGTEDVSLEKKKEKKKEKTNGRISLVRTFTEYLKRKKDF